MLDFNKEYNSITKCFFCPGEMKIIHYYHYGCDNCKLEYSILPYPDTVVINTVYLNNNFIFYNPSKGIYYMDLLISENSILTAEMLKKEGKINLLI